MTDIAPDATKALRVPNWERYEPADSRKCRVMQWVAVPINHDGLGYLELMARPDGVRMIGAWLLILQIAARCPVRGLLITDSGRVLRAREIALKTRASESDISDAIQALMANGWLVEVDASTFFRTASGRHSDGIRTTGQDRQYSTREDSAEAHPPSPPGMELLTAALKASGCAGTSKRDAEALEEWIAWTTNEVEARDDAEAAAAVTHAVKAGKRNGVAIRYARQAHDLTESARAHLSTRRLQARKGRDAGAA
jgi:hypothetical protein